jgi:hypothetical protein
MRVHVDIGGSEALELKGALLVYQGHSRSLVSWHEARAATEPGAPYLGEATPVSMEFVRQLSEGLGTHLPVEVLPENVLVRTPETMVWWTPPCGKTMFFADHDPEAARLNGQHVPSAAAGLASDGERSYGSVRSRRRQRMANFEVDGRALLERGWRDRLGRCQGSMRSPDIDGITAIPDRDRDSMGASSRTKPEYGA